MANNENSLKTYIAPWHGQLLLACRKCQKKLRDDDQLRSLAKLKKTVKRHNKAHPGAELFVLNVPCMDLCPKDGVTVCFPARQPVGLSILRGEEDLARIGNVI
jgi:predicted metal-binding protein